MRGCRHCKKIVLALTNSLSRTFSISCKLRSISDNYRQCLRFFTGFFGHFTVYFFKCWFAGKTRNSKEECHGDFRSLTPARASNLPEETETVFFTTLLSDGKTRQSLLSPVEGRHLEKLTEISVSLNSILDLQGKENSEYHPRIKLCNGVK